MSNEQIATLTSKVTGNVVSLGADVAPQPLSPVAANEAVTRDVSSWKGVTLHVHRFGGVEFRLGRRELGHLHAFIADLPFPRRIRDELVASGRARSHHVLPNSGWVTAPMRTASEVANVIDLFRMNHQRAAGARAEEKISNAGKGETHE